jgi:hypothetical protein
MGCPWVGFEICARSLASHPRAHAHAQYGLVAANYAMHVAISYAICPKSHRTPDVVAIMKIFSKITTISQVRQLS